jgi:hypothetical protein
VGNHVSTSTVSANEGNSPGDSLYGNIEAGGAGGGGRMIIETATGSDPSGTFAVAGGANPYANNSNFTGYGGGTGSLSEISAALTAPNVTIDARKGAGSVTADYTFTSSGSSGSVVFGQFRNSATLSHLTGIPTAGTTFALDSFTPTVTYQLTYTPTANDNNQTTSPTYDSNIQTIRPTITTDPVGPTFQFQCGLERRVSQFRHCRYQFIQNLEWIWLE